MQPIKVVVEYPAGANPRDYRSQIGKIWSAINSTKFRKLKREGLVKTTVRRADGK